MACACRACGSAETTVFFEVASVPVHSNLLYSTAAEALGQKTGSLTLSVCSRCAFIQNDAHDPALVDYDESYEDAQGHSSRFQDFAESLVERLVTRYGIESKTIVEIGSGQGAFLGMLCERGANEGIGFDPAYRGPRRVATRRGRMEIRSELFDGGQQDLRPDFVFMRHTLEHIAEVDAFVGMMSRSLPAGIPVYFEVPETGRILRERAFWDVYYEHPSYFSQVALETLVARNGFSIVHAEVGYEGQYLMVEAKTPGLLEPRVASSPEAGERVREVVEEAARFGHEVESQLDGWSADLSRWAVEGKHVALWGAGSKAVGFLTATGAGKEVVAIVDINPAKQGAYQGGTGHPIVAPDALIALGVDIVIIMNPIYREEIERQLRDLGVDVVVRVL